jgi:dTDP-4-amino-4,6-dideoxygalactose transaminase
VKLRHLDGWTARRQQNAAFYDAAFARVGLRARLVSTPAVTQSRHIFNQYVVRVADRDAVRDCLKQQHIMTEVYYPVPMHLQECFADLGHRAGQFPESEKAALNTLALPVYPEVTAAQKQRVVEAIASCYQKMGRLPPGRAA